MPMIWRDCAKIHEGCGGVARWVEAIDRPGVGWHGECTRCQRSGLPTEAMVPIEEYDEHELRSDENATATELADLHWDEGADWEANQRRLAMEIDAMAGGRAFGSLRP